MIWIRRVGAVVFAAAGGSAYVAVAYYAITRGQ